MNNQELVLMYTRQHLTLRQIAPLVGISAPAVWKRLKKVGVTRQDGVYIKVNCACCGKEKVLARHRWKGGKRFYCDRDCVAVARHTNPYLRCTKLARVLVKQHFKLEDQHVVVSKNGIYEKRDLIVFRSAEDYLKYCHGGKVKPIWEG